MALIDLFFQLVNGIAGVGEAKGAFRELEVETEHGLAVEVVEAV